MQPENIAAISAVNTRTVIPLSVIRLFPIKSNTKILKICSRNQISLIIKLLYNIPLSESPQLAAALSTFVQNLLRSILSYLYHCIKFLLT